MFKAIRGCKKRFAIIKEKLNRFDEGLVSVGGLSKELHDYTNFNISYMRYEDKLCIGP